MAALPEHLQAYLDPEPFLTVQQAAQRSNIHEKTLYRRIEAGILRAYGTPKAYRVRLSDVLPIADVSKRKQGLQDARSRRTA